MAHEQAEGRCMVFELFAEAVRQPWVEVAAMSLSWAGVRDGGASAWRRWCQLFVDGIATWL
jgi:hypothetical protein